MPRGNAHKPETRQAALEAFQGEESMKAIGKRLGVQYKNVRAWWEGEFGEEKIKARGKNLQAKRTRENAVKAKGKSRKTSQKDVECAVCGCTFQKSAISAAKTSRIVCSSCKDAERGGDTPCPVCGFLCNGKKGVGVHLRHQKDDPAHAEYLAQQAKPKGEEGADYVTCPFLGCDHAAKSMAGHFESVHNTTWAEVKLQYPDAQWMAKKSNEKRTAHSVVVRKRRGYNRGEKKEVPCPTCGESTEVSLYAGSIHDLRCEECKAEDELIRWAGKKELEDYVICQECGHRAEFLNSHVNSEQRLVEYCRSRSTVSDWPSAKTMLVYVPSEVTTVMGSFDSFSATSSAHAAADRASEKSPVMKSTPRKPTGATSEMSPSRMTSGGRSSTWSVRSAPSSTGYGDRRTPSVCCSLTVQSSSMWPNFGRLARKRSTRAIMRLQHASTGPHRKSGHRDPLRWCWRSLNMWIPPRTPSSQHAREAASFFCQVFPLTADPER